MRNNTLTRREAEDLIDECVTDAQLRALATHWGYDFNDQSEWTGADEGRTCLYDFLAGAVVNDDTRSNGNQDDDITDLTEPGAPYSVANITPAQLAAAFSVELRNELSPDGIRDVIDLNKDEKHPDVCHSHDFCDANMVMLAALARLLGVDQDAVLVGSREPDEQMTLWNDAWGLAKRHDFATDVDAYKVTP